MKFSIFTAKKSLYIAWASFRNASAHFGTATKAYEGSYIPNIGSSPAQDLSMQLIFGIPIMKLRQKERIKCRKQPGGHSSNGETPVASTTSLEDHSLKSSYNIHSFTVSLDKDKYLTLAPILRFTIHRSIHGL